MSTNNTVSRSLTGKDFEQICRDACAHPMAISHGASLTKADFWHTIWHKVADFIGWEDRHSPHQEGASDLDYWRSQVVTLVSGRATENIYIVETATKYIHRVLHCQKIEAARPDVAEDALTGLTQVDRHGITYALLKRNLMTPETRERVEQVFERLEGRKDPLPFEPDSAMSQEAH